MISFSGYPGHAPDPRHEGLLAHAASLAHSDIEEIVRSATPVSQIDRYVVDVNRRRYYEELTRFPMGFLVAGDAMCAFNPIYAQGMTIAALEALALRDCIGCDDGELVRRFFTSAGPIVSRAWASAVLNDLQIPTIRAARPLRVRLLNWWLQRVLARAEHDAELARLFVRVAARSPSNNSSISTTASAATISMARSSPRARSPIPMRFAWPSRRDG
jgi:2-polyprenyl-6-methoxyphenol hydroxylase-like FAD-dependent oxidoreductase